MKKINTRSLLYKLGAVLILVAICIVMFIIGRGHTIYIDNKTTEYEGQEYKAFHKVTVYDAKGEKLAKLSAKDRGMATTLGQNYKMVLEVTKEKGGEEETVEVSLKLPYNLDGIVINLPAYLNGLPEEAYMSEFVSLATESDTEEEEEIVTDEFGLGDF